jgi:TFIIF-interacting CTD phosphatase-like protein
LSRYLTRLNFQDLSRLGRDLERTLLVDNVADNFCLQPDNGILIKTWYDDMEDTQLYELIPLLKGTAKDLNPRIGRK